MSIIDTDIKSIKKAARKGIEKELVKRVNEIISKCEVEIDGEKVILNENESGEMLFDVVFSFETDVFLLHKRWWSTSE